MQLSLWMILNFNKIKNKWKFNVFERNYAIFRKIDDRFDQNNNVCKSALNYSYVYPLCPWLDFFKKWYFYLWKV